MILTVTPNPAIDKIYTVDRLAFEDRGYIVGQTESAGGRGINSSALLHSLGSPTLAILPSGGNSGSCFEKHLAGLGFPYKLVCIEQKIRSNLILTDRNGLTLKLNEPGPVLTEVELQNLQQAVIDALPGASWLLLCGSLPPNCPPGFYTRLIRAATASGVKTLLDTDGYSLQDPLLAAPTIVTPNQQEAAHLLNKGLVTRHHLRSAVLRILEMGAQSAVLSLAARGAIAARGNEVFEVIPPRVKAISPIGAGDALNAALAWAIDRGSDFPDAVRWAVAAATASACVPGIAHADRDSIESLYQQVEIR